MQIYFVNCPRCGDKSLEVLDTYAHCCGCLYFEDYYHDTEAAYARAMRTGFKILKKLESETEEDSANEPIIENSNVISFPNQPEKKGA